MKQLSRAARTLLFLGLAALSARAQDAPAQDAPADADAPEGSEEPEEPRGLRVNEAGAFPGYTLFTPLQSKTTYLLDMQGEVAHQWTSEFAPGTAVYLLDNGHLLRGGRLDDNPRFHGGGIGGRLLEYDWDGKVVWEYELANDYQTQHHDVEPLPNGNLLVIVWEHRYREDVLAAGRDPRVVIEDGLWPDAVLEIRPERPSGGEVVWEWHAWDHLIQDLDRGKDDYGSIPDRPGRIDVNADHRDQPPMTAEERRRQEALEEQMRGLGYIGGEDEEDDGTLGDVRGRDSDWLHTNAVDYNAEHDLIALSTPHLSEIWVIDHSTTTEEARWDSGGRWKKGGDLLYRWGNPRNYGAGTDADRRLFYQHDVQWIPGTQPGELRVILFNNGGRRPGGDHSSVEELVLPFDPERGFHREKGQAFGPVEPAWTYKDPERFFSAFISGAQRLPNGNTLICAGPEGRFFEVTRDGEIVWEYWNPYGGDAPPTDQSGNAPKHAVFRVTRIPLDHPGLKGRLGE